MAGSLRRGVVLALCSLAALAAASHAAAAPPAVQWCGTDTAQTDRLPEDVASYQIHVAYVIPADGVDRFAQDASPIVSEIALMDSWWRREDATRTPRFDLFAFPGCGPGPARLDLSHVRLPDNSSVYAPLAGRASALGAALAQPAVGFLNPFKKYLVYYDAPVQEPNVCGQSRVASTTGGTVSFVYVQACLADLGEGGLMAATATHELIHNLGGEPEVGPPHSCAQSPAHPCDNPSDILYPFASGAPLESLVLDYGRDDYYGHPGSWFDIQDSFWLSHLNAPQFALTIALDGRRSGTVTSDLPGIACPPACSIAWDSGARVTLTASPEDGAVFDGWGDACAGKTLDCTVTMDAVRSLTATFSPNSLLVSAKVRGRGTVRSTPAGIRCPSRCSAEFESGRAVLRAVPAKGWRFYSWSGSCGGRGRCTLQGSGPRSVVATFRRG